jgi:hypothetical protein
MIQDASRRGRRWQPAGSGAACGGAGRRDPASLLDLELGGSDNEGKQPGRKRGRRRTHVGQQGEGTTHDDSEHRAVAEIQLRRGRIDATGLLDANTWLRGASHLLAELLDGFSSTACGGTAERRRRHSARVRVRRRGCSGWLGLSGRGQGVRRWLK